MTFTPLPIFLILGPGGARLGLHVDLLPREHSLHCIVAGQLRNKRRRVTLFENATITCELFGYSIHSGLRSVLQKDGLGLSVVGRDFLGGVLNKN